MHPVNTASCENTQRVFDKQSMVYEVSTGKNITCSWDQGKQNSAQILLKI